MGKMNELSLVVKELRNYASGINALADDIETSFSNSKEKPKEEKKSVTLEEVRAILAEKSRSGKTAET